MHICQARFEVQAEKGQHVPCKSPGERELGVVQEARSWRPILVGADLLRHPVVLLAKRVRSGTHHQAPDIALFEGVKGHWTQEGYEGPLGTGEQTLFRPSAYVDLQPLGLTWSEEKSDSPFVSTPRPQSRIGLSVRVFQQVSASQTPVVRTLDADLSTDCQPLASPKQSGEGSLKH